MGAARTEAGTIREADRAAAIIRGAAALAVGEMAAATRVAAVVDRVAAAVVRVAAWGPVAVVARGAVVGLAVEEDKGVAGPAAGEVPVAGLGVVDLVAVAAAVALVVEEGRGQVVVVVREVAARVPAGFWRSGRRRSLGGRPWRR